MPRITTEGTRCVRFVMRRQRRLWGRRCRGSANSVADFTFFQSLMRGRGVADVGLPSMINDEGRPSQRMHPSPLLPTGNQANNSKGNVDVDKLLGILACLQGTSADIGGSSISGDNVVQVLSKMQSVPVIANNASRLPPASFRRE